MKLTKLLTGCALIAMPLMFNAAMAGVASAAPTKAAPTQTTKHAAKAHHHVAKKTTAAHKAHNV